MKRILAAIDGSAGSARALDLAVDLAKTYDASLILLAVAHHGPALADPAADEFARIEHLAEPVRNRGLRAAEAILGQARIDAREKGVHRIETEAAFGDPAHEIIGIAADKEVDLIVLGSRGMGRLAGLLLGSIAQKVLGHATSPVLVVR